MRIGFLSDLHTDYNHLYTFTQTLAKVVDQQRLDALCLLGDTATGAEATLTFCEELQQALSVPLRILPGNHDIFVAEARRKRPADVQEASRNAYFRLLHHPQLSLYKQPIVTRHWFVAGISGWFDYSFAAGAPEKLARHPISRFVWPDQRMINGGEVDANRDQEWVGNDLRRLSELFNCSAACGKKRLVALHFLPTAQLFRPKHVPFYKHFNVQLGSARYQRFFEENTVSVSVSGHSHMPGHCIVNGIDYRNVSLGYAFQWADAGDLVGEMNRVLYVLEDE